MLDRGSPATPTLFPLLTAAAEGFAADPLDDSTGVNRLFAEFEANASDSGCGDVAEHLAGGLFRFMMLDRDLLAYSLGSACQLDCPR
jgi:hypothetical protein